MISLLSFAALAWWSCSTAVLLLSATAALLHPLRRRERGLTAAFPPLSAIVPVKDVHAGFTEAQLSLFAQPYKPLEILIAAADVASQSLPIVRSIQDGSHGAESRIVISDCTAAASPKFNNLWPAICQARNDLVLTKDSNILLAPGDIEAFVECLTPEAGLVSAIPIATQLPTFAAWIEASIINCYHARVLMLGDAIGLGFGLGKIMLFRRSDLLRAGGLDGLKWAVGEDMAIARAMRRLDLGTVLAGHVCHQIIGPRSLHDVWLRQLRWMTIWRVQLPVAFVVDLLGAALPTAIAGAAAAPLMGLSSASVFTGTFVGWFAIEFLLSGAKGWPISMWSPLAFVARELLTIVLWLRALTTNDVQWGGATHRVRKEPTPRAPELSAENERCVRGRAE